MPLNAVIKRASFKRCGYLSSPRSLSHFRVVEHTVATQHTRHWPRGTEVGHENALELAVKQYVPKSNQNAQPGDVTFIAAHANGFPKVGDIQLAPRALAISKTIRNCMSLCSTTSKRS